MKAVLSLAKVAAIYLAVVLSGMMLITWLMKPSARSEEASAANVPLDSIRSPEGPPQTVNATIRNYRSKGDSIDLQCSGATGSIRCKPAP